MKKQITKKELEQLYNEQKLTIKEIGIKINKSATTVRNYMEKYNIKAKLHKKEKECIVCGKIYTGKINSKYCSDKCKRKAYKKRYKKECLICGNNFTSANKKSKYCSQRCRTRAAYKTKLEGYKKYKSNCLWCGNEFELVLGDNFSREQKYCSKKCADAKWAKDRVAKKNNVHEEDIYLKELYDKQKGICGLCGKKVNFDTDSKNNRRPTISYIIPLEEGGKHNYKNAIISHIDCHKLGPSYELKCKKCKNIFLSRDNMEKYCSRNCKKEDNPETCEWCGKKFVSYFGQKCIVRINAQSNIKNLKESKKRKRNINLKKLLVKNVV